MGLDRILVGLDGGGASVPAYHHLPPPPQPTYHLFLPWQVFGTLAWVWFLKVLDLRTPSPSLPPALSLTFCTPIPPSLHPSHILPCTCIYMCMCMHLHAFPPSPFTLTFTCILCDIFPCCTAHHDIFVYMSAFAFALHTCHAYTPFLCPLGLPFWEEEEEEAGGRQWDRMTGGWGR